MTIYFAGSIRGGRIDALIYKDIINFLTCYGSVLTEHIADQNLNHTGESELSDKDIYKRDVKWMMNADILIAEVSNPSIGVGYEIGSFIQSNKPIICLYRKNSKHQLSAMISGCDLINLIKYSSIDNLKKNLDVLMKKIVTDN